jgi:hypothetical protein
MESGDWQERIDPERPINLELFGEIRYNTDDQLWTGAVRLGLFAAFGESWADDEAERRQRSEGILPLAIPDPTGKGPSRQQEQAFRFVRDHEADVFRAVLGALFESYQAYTASPLSGFWERIGAWFGIKPIQSPEGLGTQARFTGLELAREHLGGVAHALFVVHCEWEPEHGMMVVYHKDRPASWTTFDALELESETDEG